MKRTIGIVALVIGCMLAGSVWAQDDGGRERGRRRRGRGGEWRERRRGDGEGERGGRGQAVLGKVLDELKLSPEKRAKVDEILKAHHEEMAAKRKENGGKFRDLRKQMAAARRAGDKDKAKELGQKMRELGKGRAEGQQALLAKLGKVLTKEQVGKVAEAMKPRRRASPRQILAAIKKLDLTQTQQAEMKKILAEAKAKADKAEGRRGKSKIFGEAVGKVVKEVLTDAQRKKLQTMRARQRGRGGDRFAGLDLTPEQETKIKAIEETFREAIKKADTREARREAFKARMEGVKSVLSEEQLKKLRQRGRGRGRRGGRGGEGEGRRRRGRRGGDSD